MNNNMQKKIVNENKLLEKKLKESEQRYQALVENSPDMIAIHNGETFIYINPAGIRLLGAESEKDVVGQSIWKFIKKDYHPVVKQRIQRIFAENTKADWYKEKFIRLDGQEIDVEVSSVPIQSGQTKCAQVFVRDISKQLQVDEWLIKSEKLSVLGELAAGIAHEIRNPLTSLRGFTQLLQASVDGDQKGFCEIMLSELDRINLIVSELLIVSKPQPEKLQKVSLEKLVRETVTLFQSQANLHNVQIFEQFAEGIPTICGEANQLKQVLINLMKNAMDAMPKGGKLYISLARKGADNVALVFTDTGIGISKNHLDKLGEPFYTTKERGTGLGLMICFRIIENHHGNIHITSQVDKGTRIEIVLPIKTMRSDWIASD